MMTTTASPDAPPADEAEPITAEVVDPAEAQHRAAAPVAGPVPALLEGTTTAMPVHTEAQLAIVRDALLGDEATDAEMWLFINVCNRTGLDPFARQIYGVMRYDNQSGRKKMTIQTGIDGFRLIAQRTGEYQGQVGPFWCGEDEVWREVWLDRRTPPSAAKVGIVRDGHTQVLWGIATFESYAQRKRDGSLMGLWKTMPEVMIAKCAEANGLRKAFPQEMSGVYTSEEMGQAGNTPAPTVEGWDSLDQQTGTFELMRARTEQIEEEAHRTAVIEWARSVGFKKGTMTPAIADEWEARINTPPNEADAADVIDVEVKDDTEPVADEPDDGGADSSEGDEGAASEPEPAAEAPALAVVPDPPESDAQGDTAAEAPEFIRDELGRLVDPCSCRAMTHDKCKAKKCDCPVHDETYRLAWEAAVADDADREATEDQAEDGPPEPEPSATSTMAQEVAAADDAASSGTDWKDEAKTAGVSTAKALTNARRIAREHGVEEPMSLATVPEAIEDAFADWLVAQSGQG
jgi:phage recombination protein Bet